MARIRTIKPEFSASESMGRVSRDARLTFILLWTQADDSGRVRGRSRLLANLMFPYDEDALGKIDGWLEELIRERCLVRYESDGTPHYQITKWRDHQRIDRPTPSRLPGPDSDADRKCSAERPDDVAASESDVDSRGLARVRRGLGVGMEGNGREGRGREECSERSEIASEPPVPTIGFSPTEKDADRKCSAERPGDDAASAVVLEFPICGAGSTFDRPLMWLLTSAKLEEYRQAYPGLDVLAECRRALQWCRDNPAKRKTRSGMPAFLSRWIAKAVDRGGGGSGSTAAPLETPEKRADRVRRQREAAAQAEEQRASPEEARKLLSRAMRGIGGMPK